MRVRMKVAAFRRRFDPLYRAKWRRIRAAQLAANLPYERGEKWSPQVMSIEETLRDIIGNRRSVARFGDGEFALVCGRKMLFENANGELGRRLAEILANPDPRCLVAICDVFGRLDGILPRDWTFWREVMQWAREGVCRALHADYRATPPRLALGNAYISRPYMQVSDRTIAPRAFGLWKELVADKDLLIVEGRFSRLGVGNDLLSGAKSIRRIWCPPRGAFARYGEILAVVRAQARPGDLVLLALGATATVLAYDLAKSGLWAVDAGHVDVEYMWMKMGATDKVAIPGRYVSEVVGGQERCALEGERERLNVVATVGEAEK